MAMKTTDKFTTGKHTGRSLKTVLNADFKYIKYMVSKRYLVVSDFVMRTYSLK
jgi:hypothetical protein